MPVEPLHLRVECQPGQPEERAPRCIYLGDRKVEVEELVDRWLATDCHYFKFRGDDGALYIVRHDVPTGSWELTLYDRSGGESSA